MKKRLLSFVLAVLMIASLLPATALAADIADSGTCGAEGDGSNLTWTLDSEGVLTISGSGDMHGYDLPGAPWYGSRSRVKSAVIAEGVTSIGGCAFYDCRSLTSVTIPDSVTRIGSFAFDNCRSLTSVTIPNGVTSIGTAAFDYCTSLTSVTIPDSVTSIDWDAFYYCTSLTDVYYAGSEAQWKAISISSNGNDDLLTANIHYNYVSHTHSYKDVVTAPTCTEKGYTTHTCACGDSYRDSYVGALGHDYVGGVCTRCGAKASDPQPGTQPCDGGAQCPGRGFSDMPGPADWSHEGIDYAVSHGLFVGTSDTTFSPASAMTRAMLVSVLWRMEGEPAHTDRNPFTDVGREWYTDGVLWAAEHDIVAGIGDGRFDPDGDVTREQIAAILCRYTLWKGRSADARADLRVFPDARDVSGWAYDSLAWANAEDLISGCMIGSISHLKPLDNATRAQVAAILMRYQQSIGA